MNWLISNWQTLIGFAVVFIVANVVITPGFWTSLGNLRIGGTKTTVAATPEADEEYLDMLALHRLEARFERLKCKDGQDAMKTAGSHFFHKQGDDAPKPA